MRSTPPRIAPVEPDPRFAADLSFLGNRLPDREARVEQFEPAALLPGRRFLIGSNGWKTKPMPPNVVQVGHVFTHQMLSLHAACSAVPRAGCKNDCLIFRRLGRPRGSMGARDHCRQGLRGDQYGLIETATVLDQLYFRAGRSA